MKRPGLIRGALADLAGVAAVFAIPVALLFIAHGFGF